MWEECVCEGPVSFVVLEAEEGQENRQSKKS